MQPLASPCKPRPAGDLRSAFAIWDLQRDSPRKLTPCLVIFDVTLKISYTLALQMRLKARSAICNLYLQAAEQSAATPGTLYTGLFRSPGTPLLLDEGARLNLMLNQYKVGGKGDDAMQFFQIPYGETRQIRRKGDGSGGSSKKRKRGAAVSQGDEGLPPDDGEAEGGGKSAGDGEEIAASFAV
jgi:hypothetical protein